MNNRLTTSKSTTPVGDRAVLDNDIKKLIQAIEVEEDGRVFKS